MSMRARRRHHDEVGATSLVQTVIVAPVLLLMLMFIVQFALVAHAQSVAKAAAQQGASVAGRYDGTTSSAKAETVRYLDSLGPRMLTSRNISVSRSPTDATVIVTGRVISLVPGIHPRLNATATAARERYVHPIEEAN